VSNFSCPSPTLIKVNLDHLNSRHQQTTPKGEAIMSSKTNGKTSVIAVYPDHAGAEDVVRRLQADGIPMQNVSIIGKDFQAVEKPIGFVTTGTVAKDGAKVGAWTGGLFGLLIGAAFLILPGVGPVIIAGPLAAALLGGAEGALAGAAFGGMTGALVGLGVSRDKAIRYESEVRAGKFLVTLQGEPAQIERARSLLTAGKAESAEVVGPSTSAA
jgi:tetrahydromethanopterin S-methyltransferase subunit G